MRKKILLMLSVFCFMGATVFGQAIEGGAGIIHVSSNPNLDVTLNTLSSNEGNVAYNQAAQTVYYYKVGTAADDTDGVTPGTHWTAVDVSTLVDPITSIVVTDDGVGPAELTATTVGGVTTLEFQSNAAITFNNTTNVLTFTDVDGDLSTVDFTLVSDLVDIQAGDASITVGGNGTAATPYLIEVTGANGSTIGTVPTSADGLGALSWKSVVESITVDAGTLTAGELVGAGRIMIKPTTGPAVALNLDDLPEVANMADVTQAIANISSGESAFVKAAASNTFGMPATSGFGVIFVIERP